MVDWSSQQLKRWELSGQAGHRSEGLARARELSFPAQGQLSSWECGVHETRVSGQQPLVTKTEGQQAGVQSATAGLGHATVR